MINYLGLVCAIRIMSWKQCPKTNAEMEYYNTSAEYADIYFTESSENTYENIENNDLNTKSQYNRKPQGKSTNAEHIHSTEGIYDELDYENGITSLPKAPSHNNSVVATNERRKNLGCSRKKCLSSLFVTLLFFTGTTGALYYLEVFPGLNAFVNLHFIGNYWRLWLSYKKLKNVLVKLYFLIYDDPFS